MTSFPPPSPGFDIARLRTETPGVGHRPHVGDAVARLMPCPVVDAETGQLCREAEDGGDEAAGRSAAVEAGMRRLAIAAPAEIALEENATVARQMAFCLRSGPGLWAQ